MENEAKKRKYSEAQRKAMQKWRKENIKLISLRLVVNTPEDAEILAWLETVPNKSGAMKAALLKAARGE